MRSLSNVTFLILHLILGAVSTFFPVVLTIWVPIFSLYALQRIFRYGNRDGYAAVAAAYLVSMEVMYRMLEGGIPWEFGKYIAVFFLLMGMLAETWKKPFPLFAILYFVCLLPSILVLDFSDILVVRGDVSFNLSGPLCLAIAVIYFYKRPFTNEDLSRIFFALVLGIVSMMVVILIRMPSIESIDFSYGSNFYTSGGFGPNQVSVMLGVGFLIMGMAWFLNIKVTGIPLLDKAIGGASLVLGILTFARGGIIVPALVLFLCAVLMAMRSSNPLQFIRAVWVVGGISLMGGAGYLFVNNLTHEALTDRYSEAQKTDEVSQFDESLQVEGINLSGRESIFLADVLIFMNNPILGVGPGAAMEVRQAIGGLAVAAHTEQSRLLAEHGVYGMIALMIIIIAPLTAYRSAPNLQTKLIAMAFTLFCFLTMTHNGMRLGTPSLLYGLGFALLLPKLSNPLMRAKKN